ncbi:MAG: SDR family NAD(P)-dependent oxidoreductase [Planctomycetota bacterium]
MSRGDRVRVIVTGASRGIGRGIASVLARDGFSVGLLARSEDLLAQLAADLKADGTTVEFEVADLRDATSTQTAIDRLADKLGGVEVLVNNAGRVLRKDVRSISVEEWTSMVETNVNGPFFATRAALPWIDRAERGHIINVSSISGRLPLPGGSGYAASKYAMTGFSESLFHELRDSNIKVTTVFPGSVDSESHRHDPDEDHSWKVTPEEVGEACRDLLRTSPRNCISRLEIRPLRKP